jgi:predicted AlkP superfamily phosphohydrolase/phosphomutase
MLSGKDPGQLGLYGFRHRHGPGYEDQGLVHARLLPNEMLWHWAGARGLRTVLLGLPPSYPPLEIEGAMVSCLLTPEGAPTVAYPPALGKLIAEVAPDYQFDIAGFRCIDDAMLFLQAAAALQARFRLARELARREAWDLFVMTDIGADRVQHGLWNGQGGSGWGPVVRSYYRLVDEEIGRWLAELPGDACVWVVSDHGAQPSRGGFYLNEWLRQHGWLHLRDGVAEARSLTPDRIDWERSIAWAEGGYVGRIYLNVRGRQPRGVLSLRDVGRVREELRRALARGVRDGAGDLVPMRAYEPEELYREVRGFPPDLFVYADELRLRVFGGTGSGRLFSDENDQGRDRANHHPDGMYICYDPLAPARRESGVLSITSVRAHLQAQLAGEPSVPGA